MDQDDIRIRVNKLKEAQENKQKDAKTMELLLLWDFVKYIAENVIEEHKKIAEYMVSSDIKSVDQRDFVNDQIWNKPFASFAEFESALKSNDAHIKI